MALPQQDHATWAQIAPYIDEALEELPADVRELLIHRYLEGRTIDETSEASGIPRSTVARRVDRGIDELSAKLKKAGFVAPAVVLGGLLTEHAATAAPIAVTAALTNTGMAAAGVVPGGAGATAPAPLLGSLKMAALGLSTAGAVIGTTLLLGRLAGPAPLAGAGAVGTRPVAVSTRPFAPRAGYVTGTLLTADGTPIDAATVHAFSEDIPEALGWPVEAHSKGIFQIPAVSAAPFSLDIQSGDRAWQVLTHPPTNQPFEVRFPSLAEQQVFDEMRRERMQATVPTGVPVKMVDRAFYVNPANLGPYGEDGVWKVRGIKVTGLIFRVDQGGAYDLVLRVRNPGRQAPVILDAHIRNGPHFARFALEPGGWQQQSRPVDLQPGDLYLSFTMTQGWGADIDTIGLMPKGK